MATGKLKIVFMGTPAFAVPSLETLLKGPDRVVAVITQPDRPKGRGRKLTPPPVKEVAQQAGIPVLQPARIKGEDFVDQLAKFAADLFVVVAYGRILPGHLLNLPRLGTINVHGSLLPKYRGAAPIQRALINGETETGVTIMQMDEGMDTGDILLMEKIAIHDTDTSAALFAKLADLGGRTLARALELLKKGALPPSKQDEALASTAPLLCKHEGELNWDQPARLLSCLIRGLDPWPTAHTLLAGKRLRLFVPEVVPGATVKATDPPPAPGTLYRADGNGLLIATARDYLLVKEVQPDGKKRMSVNAYLKGNPLQAGLRLGC